MKPEPFGERNEPVGLGIRENVQELERAWNPGNIRPPDAVGIAVFEEIDGSWTIGPERHGILTEPGLKVDNVKVFGHLHTRGSLP